MPLEGDLPDQKTGEYVGVRAKGPVSAEGKLGGGGMLSDGAERGTMVHTAVGGP